MYHLNPLDPRSYYKAWSIRHWIPFSVINLPDLNESHPTIKTEFSEIWFKGKWKRSFIFQWQIRMSSLFSLNLINFGWLNRWNPYVPMVSVSTFPAFFPYFCHLSRVKSPCFAFSSVLSRQVAEHDRDSQDHGARSKSSASGSSRRRGVGSTVAELGKPVTC